jgi:ribonuclease R
VARRRQQKNGEEEAQIATASLQVNPGGFGFADRVDGEGTIFVPPGNFGGAMDGDEVVLTYWPAERGPVGQVRSVVRRARTRITGVLRRRGRAWTVEPDDPRVLGRGEVLGRPEDALPGLVVLASIVDYPDPWNEGFSVTVERVLGPPESLVAEEAKILVEHGIDPELPQAVKEEAEAVPTRVQKSDHDGRDDLRDVPFMTIDPQDARDFDDAVCVELLGKDPDRARMRVHVAVADVSHYVRPGTAIDDEAARRCLSTYLPDRAINMLPEELSSGICSLVPGKDRCAVVVTMDLDRRGKPAEVAVRAALIHSRTRLTYEQVATELSGEKKLPPRVRQRIFLLRKAADRLRSQRLRRGAMELTLPEVKVVLDEDDPERIRGLLSARSSKHLARAYNLIEEFMLAANEAVARVATNARLPVIYRVHDRPDEARLEHFAAVADLLGLPVTPEELRRPRRVQKLIQRMAGHPSAEPLQMLLLRSMAQAEYDTANIGHFALASSSYLHFTSPIRRYPDLVNHRVMKAYLQRRGGQAGPSPIPEMPHPRQSQSQAALCCEREHASTQAEREAKNLFAAIYMRDRVGDRFEGTVTGMVEAGVFVTLDDPLVDGMVKRSSIERQTRGTYELDELGVRMVAARGGRAIALGDRVIVEVQDASPTRRQIDFAFIAKLS